MDKEIKIARIRAREAQWAAAMAAARELANNPVVELIGGMAAVEYLLNNPKNDPVLKFGAAKQAILESAIVSAVVVQQLAPALPTLAQGTGNLLGTVGKLVPALAPVS